MLKPALRLLSAALIATACAGAFAAAAQDPIRVRVDQGTMEPLPIAITDFGAASPGESGVSADCTILSAMLGSGISGLRPVPFGKLASAGPILAGSGE